MNYQKLSRIKDIAVECIVWVCVFGLAFLLMALTSGCKHATQQKTLASIQLTADAAMKQWGKYVAKEQRRADSLPDGERETAHVALLVKRLKVDDARSKFSRAWTAAWKSASYKTTAEAPADIIAALTKLQTLTAQ